MPCTIAVRARNSITAPARRSLPWLIFSSIELARAGISATARTILLSVAPAAGKVPLIAAPVVAFTLSTTGRNFLISSAFSRTQPDKNVRPALNASQIRMKKNNSMIRMMAAICAQGARACSNMGVGPLARIESIIIRLRILHPFAACGAGQTGSQHDLYPETRGSSVELPAIRMPLARSARRQNRS